MSHLVTSSSYLQTLIKKCSIFLPQVRKLKLSSSRDWLYVQRICHGCGHLRPFLCNGHIIDLIFVETFRQIICSSIGLKKRNPRAQPPWKFPSMLQLWNLISFRTLQNLSASPQESVGWTWSVGLIHGGSDKSRSIRKQIVYYLDIDLVYCIMHPRASICNNNLCETNSHVIELIRC